MAVESVPFTRKGYEDLKKELHELKTIERPKIINEIAVARAHGDLSENAEYAAAREKQSFIEGRINILEDRLSRAKVIDFSNQEISDVRFGAVVTLEREETSEVRSYRIVGELEADIHQNKISLNSPIAKAILGKKINDLVEVRAPKGTVEYIITDIQYE
ncbi:MAG: transcription elongation factor GreA [Oligoflexales bacterium]|nr:transcription elongation factor GreA [Oligoflexales bacterium]